MSIVKPAAYTPPVWKKPGRQDSPFLPDGRAIVAVAATTLILAYSSLFGMAPILVFYAIWFRYLYYKGRFTLRLSPDIILPLALGGFCVFSTLWSGYPAITAKASLEFCSTIACMVIIARIVSVEALIKGLIIGIFLVLLVTFKSGAYSIDGLFGSKNEVGSYAELGLYLSLLYACAGARGKIKFLYFALPLPFFVACLVLSRSATSVVSLAAALGISYAGYVIGKLPPQRRKPVFYLALGAALIVAGLGYYMGEQVVLIHGMGKDITLTGRTYLWTQGIKDGLQKMWGGFGYFGFWVPGQPEAEKLWFHFQMYNRAGFHFHNVFVHTFVDLGLCGLVLVTWIYVSTCLKSTRFLLKDGANLTSIFFLGMAFLYLMRAVAEIDTNGPFGLGPMLFFSIIPRITELTRRKSLPKEKSP